MPRGALQRIISPYLLGIGFLVGLVPAPAMDAPAQRAVCPRSMADASGECSQPSLQCKYPGGKCVCEFIPVCSGVPQPPPRSPQWRCQAPRTDGCPEQAPAQGAACHKPGLQCSYGFCAVLIYTCGSTGWQITGGHGPPPSMPGRAGIKD